MRTYGNGFKVAVPCSMLFASQQIQVVHKCHACALRSYVPCACASEVVFVCLFVCLVNYLIMWLQPLAAYLRNSRVRDSNHPCPVSE